MKNVFDRFADRFHPAHVAPETFAEQNDVLLFAHIPKTAGVSVGAGLRGVFDVFRGVDWQQTHQSFVAESHEALYARIQKPQRQVLMGHFGSQQLNYWRNHKLPLKAAAIIREPVARVVSNYNYNRSERHPPNEEFRKRFPTLTDYVENLPYDFQLNFLLGAFYSFEQGLERLVEDFSFLGVTEHLSASLLHLSRSHGLGAIAIHEKNRAIEPVADVDPVVRRMILEKSANDTRLFELLDSYFE